MHSSFSQARKVYALDDNNDFDKLILFLRATSNSCLIRPSTNPCIMSIFSNSTDTSQEPTIESQLTDRINTVHVNYKRSEEFFMNSITQRIFNSDAGEDKQWDYFLSDQKPLQLNLDYAIGSAEADLSNLPVERLMIRTGNADVKVEYQDGMPNLVTMDTLYAKVEMGSLTINRINFANARIVIADVVFGGLFVNYSQSPSQASEVKASVGAGTLVIGLPNSARIPVVIKIHDSPLCHVSLPKYFHKTDKDTFVNDFYHSGEKNTVSFDLDVAVGHIHFIDN